MGRIVQKYPEVCAPFIPLTEEALSIRHMDQNCRQIPQKNDNPG